MKKLFVVLFILSGLLLFAERARAQEPIVQAILFYSPTCPHCHEVIENVLPPLKAQYGEQLQLVGIDTSKASGQQLFAAAYEMFAGPETSSGVPALLVGDVYLVGSDQIPAEFPGLIEEGLRQGGVPWPALPGLREAIPDLPPDAGTAAPAAVTPQAETGAAGAVLEDALAAEAAAPVESPSGLALAWAVLGGLIAALIYVVWRWLAARNSPADPRVRALRLSGWAVPALAVMGLLIALYLAYVEVTHSTAVCGPVGDCNAVQSSAYATLFGIPIAVLGAVNYAAILALWAIVRRAAPRAVPWAMAGLAVLTAAGLAFSIYLTYLEIAVIVAVCAWCLSSAVICAALLVVVTNALTYRSPEVKRAAAGTT